MDVYTQINPKFGFSIDIVDRAAQYGGDHPHEGVVPPSMLCPPPIQKDLSPPHG